MSYSLQPHRLQHAWLPRPSLSPGVCSNSCPLSQWCYPTISSSVVPFSCLHFCKHQGLFQWVSSSYQVAKVVELCFSINPSNEYSGLISFKIDRFYLLAVQGTLRSLLQHHNSNHQFLSAQPFLWSNSHICTWLFRGSQRVGHDWATELNWTA